MLTASVGPLQQEKGKFPSQPQAQVEHLKAVTALRNVKEIDKTILPKSSQDNAPSPSTSQNQSVEPPSGDKDEVTRVVGPSTMSFPISAPFPQ